MGGGGVDCGEAVTPPPVPDPDPHPRSLLLPGWGSGVSVNVAGVFSGLLWELVVAAGPKWGRRLGRHRVRQPGCR